MTSDLTILHSELPPSTSELSRTASCRQTILKVKINFHLHVIEHVVKMWPPSSRLSLTFLTLQFTDNDSQWLSDFSFTVPVPQSSGQVSVHNGETFVNKGNLSLDYYDFWSGSWFNIHTVLNSWDLGSVQRIQFYSQYYTFFTSDFL